MFGEYIARASGRVRVEYRLRRVRVALLPAGRIRDAARELAIARRELDSLPPPARNWPVADVEWRALRAQLSLADGRPARAAREAAEALDVARRALGGARHDMFWRSRLLANDVLARVHDACGDRREADAFRRATLRELTTRDVPAIERDTIVARLDRPPDARAAKRRLPCGYEVARS